LIRVVALCGLLALCACGPFGSSGCNPSSAVNVTHESVPTAQARTPAFDAIEIDQASHLLYLADRSERGVDVFDVSTPSPSFVRTVPVGGAANGLVAAPDLGKLYVGVEDGHVAVIALGTQPRLITTIPVQTAADLVDYDPREHKVFAGTGDSVAVVDAAKDSYVTTIKLRNGVEQPRYNPTDGMVYVAGSTQNVLYKIDPAADRLVATTSIEAACNPAGIAINPKLDLGLLSCTSTQTVVWDFKASHRTTLIDQATGGDIAIYDQRANRIFAAEPHAHGGSQIGIFLASPIQYSGAVAIPHLGGGVAYDETNGLVYASDEEASKGGLYFFKPPSC
jgi:DNA-binding beta-propeller fold protein YncE